MTFDPHEATVEEAIDYVRSTVTPHDVVDMYDEIIVFGDKIFSPFNPDERTPSCHLYEDGWFDFSTGKGGDVIDLYRAFTGAEFGRALHALLKGSYQLDADPDRVRRRSTTVPDLTEAFRLQQQSVLLVSAWANRLAPLGTVELTWLEAHGAIAGNQYQLFIPHWHDGAVRGIKVRNTNGQKSAVPGSSFVVGLYYPFKIRTHTTLVITEGESDCWTLASMPQHVDADIASLPSGAGLWKDRWLDDLDQYETIYTAFDNDRAGQQATEKVRSAVGWGRWKELAVPTLYKDVREAVAAGWLPRL